MANVTSTLNSLIETLNDGKAGFETAAEDVKDPSVKATFRELAQQRAQLASELAPHVQLRGKDATDSGSVSGAAHRGWMDLKSALGGGEKAILAEAERGEDAAVSEYKKAMEEDLPPGVAEIVHRQYAQVKSAHDRIRQMRDSWK